MARGWRTCIELAVEVAREAMNQCIHLRTDICLELSHVLWKLGIRKIDEVEITVFSPPKKKRKKKAIWDG